MPLFYLRRLTGRERSEKANRHLAFYLAFVAGATDAGGFFAIGHYSSHMSGVISSLSSDLALGRRWLLLIGGVSVLSFFLGSFFTTLFVRWARRRELECEYALPLIAEAALLLWFGCRGRNFAGDQAVMVTVMVLCFAMGLQNAIITKLSDAVIRTTHLTGMVTDIGIALGRIVSSRWRNTDVETAREIDTVFLLSSLIGLFLAGGVMGTLGFRHIGFLFAVPLAMVLLLLAGLPVVDDVRRREGVEP
ncbi:YoaK family protein [Paracidobacterium acidisoli]|uniref:DUF1275 domain-containing protein n=1 Tax=Paracidobacterium acidisoli TaxID=2303751 RepID=A0A372IM55_9BACT|nr:YoaK family protein [Paracidobacterium acidisoli]MBT9332250.1 DUF1275 domain-containing protein [Paracidobacterium acidisoli]